MPNLEAFKEHYSLQKKEKEGVYLCEECGKSYNSANSLAYHKMTHNPVKQYQCTKCVSQFNVKRK